MPRKTKRSCVRYNSKETQMINLSSVWRKYLSEAHHHPNTRIVGTVTEFGCGIQVNLSMLKQDIEITDARKLIQKAYNKQRDHDNYQKRNKFFARKRQTRVEGFTVKQMQRLHGSRYIEAFNKITSGRAALAGLG